MATTAGRPQDRESHMARASKPDSEGPAKRGPAKKGPVSKKAVPRTAKKSSPAKKGSARNVTTKKAPTKKAASKKVAAKKAPAKKAPAKKAPAKKAPAKKVSVKKAPVKKAAAKKAPARTAPAAKKAPAKKAAAKVTSPYDKKFLQQQRESLLVERSRLTNDVEALDAEANELAMMREPGDVQFDEESGEGDTLAVERERDLALSAQFRIQIEDIDHALKKVDAGTYGVCEASGLPIPKERLKAIPWARERVEYKVGGFGRR
jgi:RNA polymerase-binding transcription factor DksA